MPEAHRSPFALAVARLSRHKNTMKIMIGAGGTWIPKSEEMPVKGETYYLENADDHTPPMRRLWESLVDIAYRSGEFSADTLDRTRFRSFMKKNYGEGFDRLRYVDSEHRIQEAKSVDDIPDDVILDFNAGNTKRIMGVLKSTTRYTKRQFSRMIDCTINAMIERGIDTPRFRDIVEEISKEKRNGEGHRSDDAAMVAASGSDSELPPMRDMREGQAV